MSEKYTNKHGQPCFMGVNNKTALSECPFHKPKYQGVDGENFALHTNLGTLTVVDRMTGFGWRDIETGYRDKDDNLWLASGGVDVRQSGCVTVSEAIQWVKDRANTCIPDRDGELEAVKKERDEARREVCNLLIAISSIPAIETANRRGWDYLYKPLATEEEKG